MAYGLGTGSASSSLRCPHLSISPLKPQTDSNSQLICVFTCHPTSPLNPRGPQRGPTPGNGEWGSYRLPWVPGEGPLSLGVRLQSQVRISCRNSLSFLCRCAVPKLPQREAGEFGCAHQTPCRRFWAIRAAPESGSVKAVRMLWKASAGLVDVCCWNFLLAQQTRSFHQKGSIKESQASQG